MGVKSCYSNYLTETFGHFWVSLVMNKIYGFHTRSYVEYFSGIQHQFEKAGHFYTPKMQVGESRGFTLLQKLRLDSRLKRLEITDLTSFVHSQNT